MKIVVNLLLGAVIALIIWLLVVNIREPIAFKKEKEIRENAVIEKLKEIRTAQDLYRSITGSFSGSFDSLKHTLQTDSFMIVNVMGDPDDPDNPEPITYDTTYLPAMDSVMTLGINLDSLRYVPYGEGAEFEIQADTIEYQKTEVQVVEVGVQRKTFMGPYADVRFGKYDNNYDPNGRLKFGDMNSPNTAGNWER